MQIIIMGVFDKYTNERKELKLEISRDMAFALISRFVYKFDNLSTYIFELSLQKFEATSVLENKNLKEDLEKILNESSDEIIVDSCLIHFTEKELLPLFAMLVDGAFSDSEVSKKQARCMNLVQESFNIGDTVTEKMIEIAKLKFGYDLIL